MKKLQELYAIAFTDAEKYGRFALISRGQFFLFFLSFLLLILVPLQTLRFFFVDLPKLQKNLGSAFTQINDQYPDDLVFTWQDKKLVTDYPKEISINTPENLLSFNDVFPTTLFTYKKDSIANLDDYLTDTTPYPWILLTPTDMYWFDSRDVYSQLQMSEIYDSSDEHKDFDKTELINTEARINQYISASNYLLWPLVYILNIILVLVIGFYQTLVQALFAYIFFVKLSNRKIKGSHYIRLSIVIGLISMMISSMSQMVAPSSLPIFEISFFVIIIYVLHVLSKRR